MGSGSIPEYGLLLDRVVIRRTYYFIRNVAVFLLGWLQERACDNGYGERQQEIVPH